MYKIKFTPYRPEMGTIYHRQTKNHSLCSLDGRYRFYIDEEVDEPDFWVVQGKGIRQQEICRVAPQNTIFMATEPKSVLVYPEPYLCQFGHVCICQQDCKSVSNSVIGTQVHHSQAILPWFIGYKEDAEGNVIATKDYDTLRSSPTPEKTKLISVISSNKAFTQGHIDRIRFVEKLKVYFGDKLDVFGRGSNPFDDKYDVLAPYKYHIVIENSSEPYYWTEKLGDCYLAEAFPLYHGCTNVSDYFPHEAYESIDIRKPEEAIRIIEQQIAAERYEKSVAVLHDCKERMLDEYNMFEFVARFCDQLNPDLPKRSVAINPCKSSSDWHNLWNYTIGRSYYNLKSKFYGRI